MLRQAHHADGTPRRIHLGAWKKQHFDPRDAKYGIKLHGSLTTRPAVFDGRSFMAPIKDQEELGSCTAHGSLALVEANEIKKGAKLGNALFHAALTASAPIVLAGSPVVNADGSISFGMWVKPGTAAPTPPAPPAPKLINGCRLFQYYGSRKLEGTIPEDSGATVRDAVRNMAVNGVCDEALWPYDITKFATNPPPATWTAAATHKVTSYHAITDGDIETMKVSISAGFPVVYGFQVYDYMLSASMAKNGILPLPAANETIQGGHCVVLCGYDDTKKLFLVRNSWGTNWGIAGYFWMAYDYIANPNLSSDFWIVQSSPLA